MWRQLALICLFGISANASLKKRDPDIKPILYVRQKELLDLHLQLHVLDLEPQLLAMEPEVEPISILVSSLQRQKVVSAGSDYEHSVRDESSRRKEEIAAGSACMTEGDSMESDLYPRAYSSTRSVFDDTHQTVQNSLAFLVDYYKLPYTVLEHPKYEPSMDYHVRIMLTRVPERFRWAGAAKVPVDWMKNGQFALKVQSNSQWGSVLELEKSADESGELLYGEHIQAVLEDGCLFVSAETLEFAFSNETLKPFITAKCMAQAARQYSIANVIPKMEPELFALMESFFMASDARLLKAEQLGKLGSDIRPADRCSNIPLQEVEYAVLKQALTTPCLVGFLRSPTLCPRDHQPELVAALLQTRHFTEDSANALCSLIPATWKRHLPADTLSFIYTHVEFAQAVPSGAEFNSEVEFEIASDVLEAVKDKALFLYFARHYNRLKDSIKVLPAPCVFLSLTPEEYDRLEDEELKVRVRNVVLKSLTSSVAEQGATIDCDSQLRYKMLGEAQEHEVEELSLNLTPKQIAALSSQARQRYQERLRSQSRRAQKSEFDFTGEITIDDDDLLELLWFTCVTILILGSMYFAREWVYFITEEEEDVEDEEVTDCDEMDLEHGPEQELSEDIDAAAPIQSPSSDCEASFAGSETELASDLFDDVSDDEMQVGQRKGWVNNVLE